jgi:hypothetical protein
VVELIQEIGFEVMQQFGVVASAKPPVSSQKLSVSATPAAVLNRDPKALDSQFRNQLNSYLSVALGKLGKFYLFF